MHAGEPVRLPDAVIDAAVGWAVRINHGRPSDAQREAFQRWLQAAPMHSLAWQRVNGLKGFQSELQALPPRLALDTLQGAEALRQQRQAMGRRNATKLLTLAGVAVGAAWLAREQAPWQRLLADASTGVGRQETLRLADGSVVVLNTDSAVSIDLSGPSRLIVLRRGEILVTTGSGTGEGDARPFWVHTPFGRLQALGTRFTVRLLADHASVTVQDGAVQLFPAGGAAPVTVPAGESRWLMEEGTRPAQAMGFEADDWAQGVIAGRNIRLQDLLAELQRYRHGRIVCDERVADLRMSGLFHTRNADQTLQFLVQTQPVCVTYRTRFWVVVGPDGGCGGQVSAA